MEDKLQSIDEEAEEAVTKSQEVTQNLIKKSKKQVQEKKE